MLLMSFGLFFVSLVILYFFFSRKIDNAIPVPSVIASNVRIAKEVPPPTLLSPSALKLLKSEGFDESFGVVKVAGDSMLKKGLSDGDWLIIRPMDKDLSLLCKDESLIVLHVTDDKLPSFGEYKIRVFSEILEENKIQTYRFSDDDKTKKMSDPHSLDDVSGIVEKVISFSTMKRLESHYVIH